MSQLSWDSPSGATAALSGAEFAWLGEVAAGPAGNVWNLRTQDQVFALMEMTTVPAGSNGMYALHDIWRDAQAADHTYRARYQAHEEAQRAGTPSTEPDFDADPITSLTERLAAMLRLDGVPLRVDGVDLSSRDVALNTALVAGSDQVALAAKLYGWATRHCWVEWMDRSWLAGIIRTGLHTGIYRSTLNGNSLGWDLVLQMLEARSDEPVVLSYSGHGTFPDGGLDWDTAMRAHRTQHPWARLAPDTLRRVGFGPLVTAYDLAAPDRDARVRSAYAGCAEGS